MKINSGLGGNPLEHMTTSKAEQAQAQAQQPEGAKLDAPDKVSLSEEAKLRSLAMQEAQSHSGVRADRVAELKKQVQDGTYQPDAQKIAKGIVRDELDLFI